MFHRNSIAAAAFFLAAKVRKQHMSHRLLDFVLQSLLGRGTAPKAGACYQNSQYMSREDRHISRYVYGAGTGARSK